MDTVCGPQLKFNHFLLMQWHSILFLFINIAFCIFTCTLHSFIKQISTIEVGLFHREIGKYFFNPATADSLLRTLREVGA